MNTRLQTDIVRALLEARGYSVQREITIGRGLWKGNRVDFLVDGLVDFPSRLAIECKWQNSVGSADEKVAYTVYSILEAQEIPTILVCSGGELEDACRWAKTKVDGDWLVAVYDTDEFIAWVSGLPHA